MNKLKELVKDLPFALLLIDAIWWVLSFWGIYISDYWFIGELFSHSLVYVAVMVFYARLHRYCIYSWVCLFGLGLLNLLNIYWYYLNLKIWHFDSIGISLILNILNTFHLYVPFNYISWYCGLILAPCLSFTIIYKIKKNARVPKETIQDKTC